MATKIIDRDNRLCSVWRTAAEAKIELALLKHLLREVNKNKIRANLGERNQYWPYSEEYIESLKMVMVPVDELTLGEVALIEGGIRDDTE